MLCPHCGHDDDKVIDSRSGEKGRVIRRRRQCLACRQRFTTYERTEDQPGLTVIKKDLTRVPFDREKLLTALRKACYKRPVSEQQLRTLADQIEDALLASGEKEIPSERIGLAACDFLQKIDRIAYVRFATSYKTFDSAGDLLEEVRQAVERPVEKPEQGKLF